jgi:hypothetical protein
VKLLKNHVSSKRGRKEARRLPPGGTLGKNQLYLRIGGPYKKNTFPKVFIATGNKFCYDAIPK